ncbi:hypothetical protein PybrP1_003304 [[Pythium] brassicae (nom. inval.)]|nr:hypothetical protein PybrP1_003304 [[Pythium] brassicae (nom. inval.)]
MRDIYDEMEQNWKNGRFRLPLKFISFHDSAIGYALAFVKVKNLQRQRIDQALEDSKLLNDELWRERIAQAINTQADCATAMSSTYARLVLHCSNYENHKEDEHFFECVYFFVCSVAKLSVPPEYWKTMEEELGFLFRGSQFSSNVNTHTVIVGAKKDAPGPSGGAATKASGTFASTSVVALSEKDASPATSSAAKKIQSLSGSADKDGEQTGLPRFVLPTTHRTNFFTVPVKTIVAGMDATKSRAARNLEVSQTIRERIEAQKSEAYRQQLEAGVVSPRISMKTTYTTRSPTLNHLLPSTDERVRLVLR